MIISIDNAVQATYIFIAIFLLTFFLSLRRRLSGEIFSVALTHELKGFAILAILFSHIGYFLVDDHRFLFPLSIMAGVGVNLFLFLSGFGLSVSSQKSDKTILQSYRNRLSKLYIPFWLTLILFFSLDFFLLKIHYSWNYVIQSFIGIFPRADIFLDINSPLWYFTVIIFYYLLFPLVYSKKYPWFSAIIFYLIGNLIINLNPRYLSETLRLYQVHTLAFPLGIFAGGMLFSSNKARSYLFHKFKHLASYFQQTNLAVKINLHKQANTYKYKLLNIIKQAGELVLITILLIIIFYTAYHSGVGELPNVEQAISLTTMLAILILFLIKKVDIKLFHIFGFYSYEIYLLHWPIISRYDILLKNIPAWLAITIYLILFLFLGWLLKKVSKIFYKFI